MTVHLAPQFVVMFAMAVVLSLAACSAHYKIHPGAINVTDSTAYDALLVAETVIDQAQVDLNSGQLPEKAKAPLNALIRTYNLTRNTWLTYRGAVGSEPSTQSYLDQLNKNLSDLAAAIRALKEAR